MDHLSCRIDYDCSSIRLSMLQDSEVGAVKTVAQLDGRHSERYQFAIVQQNGDFGRRACGHGQNGDEYKLSPGSTKALAKDPN